MKNHLRWIVFGAAFLGLGISMPSCPGQQAMQQQIDALQTKANDSAKQIQALDAQIKKLNTDFTKLYNYLEKLNLAAGEQKASLDRIDATLKAMTAKPAPKAPKGPLKKKGH